ncbi:MAG: hypothetical protein ACD_29C00032G0002 [uncultured bacterium]|nr:MAG: hypothetical protein ACD_29C00032G0002 [uncultured bacterium]
MKLTENIKKTSIEKETLKNIVSFQQGINKVEEYGLRYFLSLLTENKVFLRAKKTFNSDSIIKNINVASKYYRFIESLLVMLTRRGLIKKNDTNHFELIESGFLSSVELNNELSFIIDAYPLVETSALLLQKTMKAYLNILSNKETFLPILFPMGSFSIIEQLYGNNPMAAYYNEKIADICKQYIVHSQDQKNKKFSILEIGAGVGATSKKLFSLLNNKQLCEIYCYTDISQAFINYAKRCFSSYDFIDFQILNIERLPIEQGFFNHYDIVIATNVLHATSNLSMTLAHTHTLLKKGGLFILNEAVNVRDFSTLTYGLTDGWWRFEDGKKRILGSPLASLSEWKILLKQTGFSSVQSFNELTQFPETIFQDIIISTV